MSEIPRDPSFDSTWALLSDGYLFISKRCRRNRSDVFATRLMLERVICMQGKEASELLAEPDAFRPECFRDWDGSSFDFVPQGGGDHGTGHRCPGEWSAIELMKTLVRLLLDTDHQVPDQDLRIDMSRMPAIPKAAS